MSVQVLSLRSLLEGVAIGMGAMALVVATAFAILTTVLHRTSETASTSVESITLVQEAQIDLLLDGQSQDPTIRWFYEDELERRLTQARSFVDSDEEQRILDSTVSAVDAYRARSHDPSIAPDRLAEARGEAWKALDALADINVSQAKDAQSSAERWGSVSDLLASATWIGTVFATVGSLLWLRRTAFAPLLALSAVIRRYGGGEREVRAAEDGPVEVREIGTQFNRMAEALEVQRRSKAALLAGVAHDLRTPLSTLRTAVAIFRPARPNPPEATAQAVLARVDRQLVYLERMATDFLDLSRLEEGTLELKPGRVDLNATVREVVDLFQPELADRRVALSLPADAVRVWGDAVRLKQVLTNLLSNALKYSPAGSEVAVAVSVQDAEAVLAVRDRGPGISEQDRQRLFEPYQRLGADGSVPGVGLGLFMVRRIVEAHHGRIELESRPGGGSTFSVRLPADLPSALRVDEAS